MPELSVPWPGGARALLPPAAGGVRAGRPTVFCRRPGRRLQAFVALGEAPAWWEQGTEYPMDYYAADGGEWNSTYHRKKAAGGDRPSAAARAAAALAARRQAAAAADARPT